MNANAYLGLSFDDAVMAAEDRGPALRRRPGRRALHQRHLGAPRALEARLAAFHGREAAMIFSSAYATILVLAPLITKETAVISDELNHNCIINAIRMSQPAEKHIYRHLDMAELEQCLKAAAGTCRRALVVTDGIFSMRGDHARNGSWSWPARTTRTSRRTSSSWSTTHGVGAFGATGRGTEKRPLARRSTSWSRLWARLKVNGGYVAASRAVIDFLRETSPCYIYSNPITPGEAAAAKVAVDIVDSLRGQALLDHLRDMTRRFDAGLNALGFETIPGEHPVVPLMVRDTARTTAL